MDHDQLTKRELRQIVRRQLWRFTIPEASKITGVPLARLRDWVHRGYIVPSRPAAGRGTKARLDRPDLYQVRLLQFLLDRGFDRKHGAEIVRLLVGAARHYMKYDLVPDFLVAVRRQDRKPEVILVGMEEAIHFGNDLHSLEDAYVVNVSRLIEEVHRRVWDYRARG